MKIFMIFALVLMAALFSSTSVGEEVAPTVLTSPALISGSIDAVAAIAIQTWPRETAITMVAIAGWESAYNPTAAGDPLSSAPPGTNWAPFSCNGFTSFGIWQIHQPAHRARLAQLTQSNDPCVWRAWLFNPVNNARIASEILAVQGFSAWSCFNSGDHLRFISQATVAVDRAISLRGQ